MRRTLYIGLLTLTAAVLLTACSSESYPGLEYENPEAFENEESPSNDDTSDTPVRVFVNEQSFFSLSAGAGSRQQNQDMTRGVGPFQVDDDEDLIGHPLTADDLVRKDLKYRNTHFYIYAFRDRAWTQQGVNPLDRVTQPTDFSIYRYATKNISGGQWDEHFQDCLIDGYDYNLGMGSTLESDNEEESGLFNLETEKDQFGDRTKIYYGSHGNIGYNFFAYSIGDVVTEDQSLLKWGAPQRVSDRIYYKNFEIDGSQDLMCGYAPPLETAVWNFEKDKKPNEKLTESERSMLLNIGAYCTFAAHRGIDPVVSLHHQLARVKFQALPGDESASNTTIDAIYVHCHNKGDFVVAHRDTTQVGFYPYEDQEGDIFVHDKPEILKDADGKQYLQPSQIHDTSIYTKDNDNLDQLTDDMIWRVYWDPSYWNYDASGKPTSKKDLSQRGDPLVLGDDMLMPQNDAIDIYIKSTYKLGEPDQRKFISHYTVSAEDLVRANPNRERFYLDEKYYKETGVKRYVFLPGYCYTVTLVVYGLSQIKVYANIDAWQEGDEEITVGEDDFNME